MENLRLNQQELPTLMGQPFDNFPEDLFIPPHALELCLETFSGPMDLLLYLIQKENINILELDISKITDQYLDYISLMDSIKFELAAEYLVMAATLAEIKSKMMLPKVEDEELEEDPRQNLISRLQEYQRYKIASENLASIDRIDRDFFSASVNLPKLNIKKREANVSISEIFATYIDIIERPNYKVNHQIDFEELSTQERIQMILEILAKNNITSFSKTLNKNEGRKGVVVSLLASLELTKDGYIEMIQNNSDEIFLKLRKGA
tara:strand:- start:460 stop:1251 length:792 start_codon:yes stop_codon:yes gene_type:complete